MGIMKLLGTSFSTILNGGNPTADRTVTFPDKDITVAGTNDVIGVGQTWQNMTGSRVLGTTYTNSTGKPIMVSVSGIGTVAGNNLSIISNGTRAGFGGIQASSQYVGATALIPAGTTYYCDISGGALTGLVWVELI